MTEINEPVKRPCSHLIFRRLAWFTLLFGIVAGFTYLYIIEYLRGFGIPYFITGIGRLFMVSPFYSWIDGKLAGWLTWFLWSGGIYAITAWLRWPRWAFPIRRAKNDDA